MIHRRLLYDDAFGVDEALNESGNNTTTTTTTANSKTTTTTTFILHHSRSILLFTDPYDHLPRK